MKWVQIWHLLARVVVPPSQAKPLSFGRAWLGTGFGLDKQDTSRDSAGWEMRCFPPLTPPFHPSPCPSEIPCSAGNQLAPLCHALCACLYPWASVAGRTQGIECQLYPHLSQRSYPCGHFYSHSSTLLGKKGFCLASVWFYSILSGILEQKVACGQQKEERSVVS